MVEVAANGSYSLTLNVVYDPIVTADPTDRPNDWYVNAYCIEPDGLIAGGAETIVPIDSTGPPTTTTTTTTPTLPLTS